MKLAVAARWARRNWISCLLMAAIIAAINMGPRGDASSEGGPDPAAESPPVPVEQVQAALYEALEQSIYRNLVQERERITAKSEIEIQLEALDRSDDPEERAARLCALGNLYQQKHGDYATAAGYYEIVINDYPDWPGAAAAYHQLITCYKRLNEPQELQLLYRRMVEVFPEGSTEYAFARAALESK
jgi:tetratricopeptide (TPR) repeat protein